MAVEEFESFTAGRTTSAVLDVQPGPDGALYYLAASEPGQDGSAPVGRVIRVAYGQAQARLDPIAPLDAAQGADAAMRQSGSFTTGALLEYSFDAGAGATIVDDSGGNHPATMSGASWTGAGRYNGGLSFDGVDDRAATTSLTLPGAFTMMAWVFNPSNVPYETIVTVGTPRNLYLNNGVITFYDGAVDRGFGAAITTNTWHHVAIVSTGTQLIAYLNGVQHGTPQNVSLSSATAVLQMGAWILGGANYDWFGGRIDDLRVFTRALSASEIETGRITPVLATAGDTTPPTATITAPADGTQVGGTISITANAFDDTGLAGVQFLLDGQPFGSEDETVPYSIAWDTTQSAAGAHTIGARARDLAGNLGTATTVSVTVNNTPPTMTITSPSAGATVAGATVQVLYSVTGNLTSVDHVHLYLDSNPVVMDVDFDGMRNLTNVPVGSHSLRGIVARQDHSEIAGSQTIVAFQTVVDGSDPVLPTVQMLSPASGATVTGAVTLSAAAGDNTGVAGVQFYVDGAFVGQGTGPSPYSFSWNSATVVDGAHTVTAVARDLAANEATASLTITSANTTSPVTIGSWSSVVQWPIPPVHMTLQPTGRVLIWDQLGGGAAARVYNPANGSLTSVPVSSDVFCSGHTLLPDGRNIVIGGQVDPCCFVGIRDTNLFNPTSQTWARVANMAYARWYPTATTLPDGRVLATSGYIRVGQLANIPEVYDPAANTWTQLKGASRQNPMYSFMFVLPDGNVFNAGPDTSTRRLNVATQTWTTVGTSPTSGHSAVMYEPGRIIKAGTLGDPDAQLPTVSRTTAVIDMTASNPAWRQVGQMAFPRAYHNMVALPDGKVLVVGGERTTNGGNVSQAVYEAEIWNPATETWSTMARMTRPRMYHSTALLLPDGRVLVAGGDLGNYIEANAEFYSPPYLFRGPRPVISTAPSQVNYGSPFNVTTPDAARITRVTLIRLGSTTHGFDQSQRMSSLAFSQVSGGISIQSPANANLAPPGHYMLFLVDSNGVPSVASIIRIAAGVDGQPPSAPGTLSASGSNGTVTLNWGVATDNVGIARYNVHRSTTSGFTPAAGNRIGETTQLSYADSGLASGTYYYRVTASDAAGNTGPPSNEGTASVTDTVPPIVSNPQPLGTLASGTTSTQISVQTNEAAVCRYGTTAGTAYADLPNAFSTTGSLTHTTLVTGLANGGTYNYHVRCQDPGGNASAADTTVSFTVSNPLTGQLAAYGFNAGMGTSAADGSGNGNTGTIVGATWTTSGRFGSALSFDGSGDRVVGPTVTLGTQFTFTAWIYNPSNSNYETIVTAGIQRDFFLRSGRLRFDTGTERNFNGPQLSTNTWHHVAVVYNGSTLTAYLNGAVYGSSVSVVLGSVSGRLDVGAWNTTEDVFSGRIDEVRVFNRALAQSELQSLSTTPVP
jgi:hypothetical protein